MTERHDLHLAVGRLISGTGLSGVVLADPACGGKHTLPLFCNQVKSSQTELCDVDMLILKSGRVRVIVEIEESNVKPVQVCGKFLASALCSHYIYRNEPAIAMGDPVLFIQILDTSELKAETAKRDQWKVLEKLIQGMVPIKDSKIREYTIVYGDQNQFVPTHLVAKQLTNKIEEFLTTG